MRAAVIAAPGSVKIIDVPEPEVTGDSVLVRVAYVGLCGTDLELLHGTSPYLLDGRARYPHSFGHEWVGLVETVGSEVDDIAVGEVVTGSTMLYCQHCEQCRAGRRNLCGRLREVGLYGHPGAAAELLAVPRRAVASFGRCTPTPAHVLVEPMVTVLEAFDAAPVRPGDRVLVVGAGTIGSLAVAVLAGSNATVDIVDPKPLTHLDPGCYRQRHSAFPSVTGTYDLVVEASGAPGALGGAVTALRPGGTCLLVGVATAPETIDPATIALSGIRITGVRHGVDHYGRAVAMFGAPTATFEALIEGVVPLDSADAAFAILEHTRTRPKVVISLA
ncbi:zinc-dependent alcohol dehydrogenase [Nocardia shimofusensis]|uniref:zinc-dependent alcohol dehydrogenase n=1 Tax=Nocardia shimofusensis TaxID=228596 RepID=UPI00082A3280|nr:alcohol dehydrogenase catalytic domain-containing protein [Nocardia shimofusensis]